MGKNYDITLVIPQGIEVSVDGTLVKVKGKKGEVSRVFDSPRLVLVREENNLTIRCKKGVKHSQNDKVMINSFSAHIVNMFNGVTDGYFAKLKVCSGHFPMQVKVEGTKLQIKNFLGEKIPRAASILNGVKVEVKGDMIEVNGIDKEKVAQTAANIEQATRITNRDRRIFQDGCYLVVKAGEEQ